MRCDFKPSSAVHGHYTRGSSSHGFFVSRVVADAPTSFSIKEWNGLPHYLKEIASEPVFKQKFKEHLTENGINDPIFSGMEERQFCLQWHSVKVTKIPENTIVLASSPLCDVQVMKVGECAWSIQYHVEVEPDTIDNWISDPDYRFSFCEQSLKTKS